MTKQEQLFEGGFRHLSSQCLHDEKNGFIILGTLSGNVRDSSPLKMSRNNTPYFDMSSQVESGDLKRIVCFSKQRYELFRKVNNSDTEGVVIKRPRFQNDDILITDYTNINTSTIIPCTAKQKITTISEVLTEAAVYDRVNIEAVISHLSNITQHESDGKMATVRTGVVHDQTGFANVSIFEELTNKVVNAKSYRFTNLNVGRFKRERVLKTMDVSKIVEIKDLEVEVENYDTKLNTVEFLGKYTSADLPSLEVQYKCPKCNNTVSIQDEIAVCGNCSTVTIGDECRSNSNIKGIVMDAKTKRKYPVSMKHDLLKEIICTPITKKIETVKNLLLTGYVFTVNTLDGEVTNAATISNTSTE